MSRETKTAYRKRISAPAQGGHCGALAARAGAEAKNLELGNTQSDDLCARRARTKERNQGGPERRMDLGFFRGERRDGLFGRQHKRSESTIAPFFPTAFTCVLHVGK